MNLETVLELDKRLKTIAREIINLKILSEDKTLSTTICDELSNLEKKMVDILNELNDLNCINSVC